MEFFIVLCGALALTFKWFEYAEKKAKEEDQKSLFDTSRLPKPVSAFRNVPTPEISSTRVNQQPRQNARHNDGVLLGDNLPSLQGFSTEANEVYNFKSSRHTGWDGFIDLRMDNMDNMMPFDSDDLYEDSYHSDTIN